MSTSESQSADASSYPRTNWYDSQDEAYDVDRDPGDPAASSHNEDVLYQGTSKSEWIAHRILYDTATFLCPIARQEPREGDLHAAPVNVEQSDPEVYVPKEQPGVFRTHQYSQKRLRRRYNPQHGYVAYGGVIADRPTDDFLALVTEVLEEIPVVLPSSERNKLEALAARLKQAGNHSDRQIIEELFTEILD